MAKWWKSCLVGLGTASLGCVLGLTPLGVEFEQDFGLSWLFRVRGEVPPPPDVAVVAMDSSTGPRVSEILGGSLGVLPRDWPRTVHARLLERLVELGAATVVFDLDFNRPKEPEDDQAFADAIARSNRTILFERLDGKRQPLTDRDGQPAGVMWVEQVVPPVALLADAARAVGPFPLPKLDEALYQFWAFKPSAGNVATMPALALQLRYLDRFAGRDEGLAGPGLPAALRALTRAPDGTTSVQQHMTSLRNAFERDPAAASAARRWLESASGRALEAGHRQALTALIGLYAGESSRYINFYGGPGTVPTVPYQDVLSGDTRVDLRDKVVFVGYSDLFDPGQPDRFYTVFTRRSDSVDLSGVEIAATAFANLLTSRAITPASFLVVALILAAFGFALGVFCYSFPAQWAIPLALASAGAYWGGVQWTFNGAALWLPLAIPLLIQLPLALVAGLLGQYLWERRQKQRFSEAVSYYVPEAVIRQLVEDGVGAQGANKVLYATCLATDMAGFTTLGERMAPGELATFMNDYFDALAKPLKKQGVDVTEFRADAIMCAWTSETEALEVRRRAVHAALGAVEAVAGYAERRNQPLSSRIGLDAGWVYVGHAGGGGHFVYSIVGDSANTAARVESLNKQLGTKVLATGPVVAGIDDVLVRRLGRFVFVGKQTPIEVVEVLEHRERAGVDLVERTRRFADALTAFEARAWSEAQRAFAAFLDAYPNDGPARLYLERAGAYAAGAPPPSDDPTAILLDRK